MAETVTRAGAHGADDSGAPTDGSGAPIGAGSGAPIGTGVVTAEIIAGTACEAPTSCALSALPVGQASGRPGGAGTEPLAHPVVHVYGAHSSREAFAIRDYLSRSVVDFHWTEIDTDEQCSRFLGGSLAETALPVVVFPDGSRLDDPDLPQIASRLGWIAAPRLREYDLSVYGAGPAGLSAAVYAASEGLSVVVVERDSVGGQAAYSSLIENYLGFPRGIAGAELAERARQQAVKFGAELLMMREGVRGEFRDNRIHASLTDGSTLVAKSNICATGVNWRRLGLPREDQLLGVGLYYGAGTGEAPQCSGEDVVVVGGGNSAGQAAMNLAQHARTVTMLVRGPTLAATLSDYLARRVVEQPNVTIELNSRITSLDGAAELTGIAVENVVTGAITDRRTGRVFVCIGGEPDTAWAAGTPIVRDPGGYLVTGADLTAGDLAAERLPFADRATAAWPLERAPFFLETNVPGSFAAGDVRLGSVKRVASAVGEGAMAVTFAHRYLAETF